MKEFATYASHRQEGMLLNANEYSENVDDALMEKIKDAVAMVMLNRYPDTTQAALLKAYSKVVGLGEGMLLAGNGSDQMLGYMIARHLAKGKKLYTLAPDFSMYDYYASSYEADVVRFKTNEDGDFDIDAFIEKGLRENVDMVMFSNPNNPTGHFVGSEGIEKIAYAFQDIPFVCDEAYVEFASLPSSVTLIERHPNLFVTRTLSKAYGLAGLRVGFLCGNEQAMQKLREAYVPYALNSVSMKIAETVLDACGDMHERIEMIKSEREKMQEWLKECRGLEAFPSQANFIYVKAQGKDKLMALFKDEGISVRDYAQSPYLRITVGLPRENESVRNVIAKYEEGL